MEMKDDNESIRIVCLKECKQLPITNKLNAYFGTRKHLSAHHYNVDAATSKQSRCATFGQFH